jgi:hypothetical protein
LNEFGSTGERPEYTDDTAGDMEERRWIQEGFPGLGAKATHDKPAIVSQPPMMEYGAFGQTGRTGCILNLNRIVG